MLVAGLGLALLLAGCRGGPEPAPAGPPDADADGIEDALDRCADSPAGQPVWDSGCPMFAGPIENLEFETGQHRIRAASRRSLEALVQALKAHPDVTIAVEGHTDNRGPAVDNLELSKQRVTAVVRYLVAGGIDPDRIKPYGYGESRPVVSNASPEGRAQNRRIEISVVSP